MTDDRTGWEDYSEKEMVQAHGETATLFLLWNTFSAIANNSDEYQGLHAPPAMTEHLSRLLRGNNPLDHLSSSIHKMVANQPQLGATVAEAVISANVDMIAFGDVLFRFGQFCAANGLLHADLVPCKCLTIRDIDLQNLLGDTDGGA